MKLIKDFFYRALTSSSFVLEMVSLASFLFAFLVAFDALARPGGGGNYSGGGGGGGGSFGGGSSGGGDGLGILIYLVIAYPEVGVPVLVIVVVASLVKRSRNPDRTTFKAVQRIEQSAAPSLGALADIKARDQGFDEAAFLNRVRKMQDKLNEAWCRGDMSPARTLLSDGLMRRFETQLSIMKHQGIRNAMADHEVLDARIHSAQHDNHYDTLHVFLSASARDVEVDAKLSYDEALEKAAKAPKEAYSEIWSFLRRPGAKTPTQGGAIEGRCPSCGAPLEMGQTAKCDHCEALVNSGEFDWVLAEITQPIEWRQGSTGMVPGLAELQAADPGFNRQAAEDRASYLFWRWIEALVLADSRPLAKVASSELSAAVKEQVKAGPAAMFKTAVGAVDLKACAAGGEDGKDRYFAKVLWSSARSQKGQPVPSANVLSIARNTGVKDSGGLSYARCPNCQGPLTENDAPFCDYCGEDLTAGEMDWVLDKVMQPEELNLGAYASSQQAQVQAQGAVAFVAAPDMGNPRERTLLLMRMAAVVMADGVVTKEERKLLSNAAKRWSVPLEAVEPILSGQVQPEVAMTMRPSNPRAFISGLIAAAMVDGKVDKKEAKLLYDVGQSLGLASGQVQNMIREFKPPAD